jgi:hypothetical protein
LVPSKKGVLGLYFWQSDVDFTTNVLFVLDGLVMVVVIVVLDVEVNDGVVTILDPVDVPLTEASTVLV